MNDIEKRLEELESKVFRLKQEMNLNRENIFAVVGILIVFKLIGYIMVFVSLDNYWIGFITVEVLSWLLLIYLINQCFMVLRQFWIGLQ